MCELMVAGATLPRAVLRLLVLVHICLPLSWALQGATWGTAEECGDAGLDRCRAFMPVPRPLRSVERAEVWGAILALEAFWPVHFGVGGLNVVRSVARLLDHGCFSQALASG